MNKNLSSEFISPDNRTPDRFISPRFHDSNNRQWFLLSVLLKQRPRWASTHSDFKLFIFREIAYINKNNELIGLGRSYIPLSIFGLKIFLRCLNPLNPKPLGVVLEQRSEGETTITVILNEIKKMTLSPFRDSIVKVNSYKRIIIVDSFFKILIEEDFIL